MKDRGTPGARLDADAELLQAIYQTALLPQNYDALIDAWASRLEEAVETLPEPGEELSDDAPEIDLTQSIRYFQTSMQLLERLDQTSAAGTAAAEAAQLAAPKLVLDPGGNVVWYNGAAARHLDLTRRSNTSNLGLDAAGEERLRARLRDLARGQRVAGGDLPLVLMLHGRQVESALFMIAEQLPQRDGPDLLLLRLAEAGWNERVSGVLQQSFGLTAAETDVVALLCEGLSLAQVAERRERQVSTLRTQLKSALRKTGTRSQPQLVRLCLSLASHIDARAPGASEGREQTLRFQVLPDGRRLPWHEIGAPDGAPVLVLHGMLDGLAFLPAFHTELSRRGLRAIMPERPWFGGAPGSEKRVPDVPAAVAQDVLDLADALGLGELRVLGHMAGALYAFAVAAMAPDRVRGILCVSGGVPIVSASQFRHMSVRQRTVAYTARYAAAALPLLLHAGVRQIEAGGIENFIDALYATSPPDIAAFSDPPIRTAIVAGVRFAVAQGYRAFEVDSYHVVRDWTHLTRASTCPVILLHGRVDPVVSAASVEGFARRLGPRAKAEIVNAAGQTLAYTSPGTICAALTRL